MNHLGMLLPSMLGFACLALAMERHQEDLFARQLDRGVTKVLRAAGWIVLCGSLGVALRQPLWSIGLVTWFGCLSAGAGVVFAALMLSGRLEANRRVRG